jgi:hypothetical protein
MLGGSVDRAQESAVGEAASRGSDLREEARRHNTGENMAIQHGSTEQWVKSSYSAGNGACVEIKSPAPGMVAVRDSKDPEGPSLDFAPEAWSAFVAEVTEGAFKAL